MNTTAPSTLPLFLLWVIGISASGVMMPGPVTAIVISKGTQSKWAGLMVAIGHAIVEWPLMAIIYFGVSAFLKSDGVQIGLGIAGGLLLIWLSVGVFKAKPVDVDVKYEGAHKNAIIAGVATTTASPYFFLWWATVGVTIVAGAKVFGGGWVVLTGGIHWLFDAVWLLFISLFVFFLRRFLTSKVQRVISVVCGLTLVGFGVYFIYRAIDLAISG
ncbi:MAG: LysE family transporter [Dehalococcoidia bacterium]|nr:LysE family transporter [Dehalococcoidia bacterium]